VIGVNVRYLPFLFDLGESINKILATLIFEIADFAYEFLDGADITIDKLMFNVSNDQSKAFFNLGAGNVYGVLGARLFVATRNIFLIMVALTFMYALLRAAISPGASKRIEAKAALANVSLSLLVVAWVPGILSFFLWLREFFLKTVMSSVALSGSSLYDIYREDADEKVNQAILFLAFVLIGLYFAFFYITIAIMQAVMLGVLPIIALQSVNDTERLKSWFRTFLGWMLIPMVDFVLFLVPIGLLNQSAGALVVLISMFALLPVRKFAFAKLGIEGADVAGIVASGATMAMAAAGRAAGRGAVGAAKSIKEDHNADKEDKENAELHDDLARVDMKQGDTTGVSNAGILGRFDDDGETGSGAKVAASAIPEGAGRRIGANDGTSGDGGAVNEEEASFKSMAGGMGSPMGESSFGSSREDDADKPFINAMYQAHANVNNFDKDGYKGHLTHEQMANFYRQRKAERHTLSRAAGRVTGQMAAAAGGGMGMMAGAMYGPAGGIAGMSMGRAIGGTAGYVPGYAGGRVVGAGASSMAEGFRGRAAVNAAKVPMDWMPELTQAPVQPTSVGASIEPYLFDSAQAGPVDYQSIADSAVPESNFSAGREAAQWLTNTYTDKTAFSVTGGIGSDLTESVAYNDRTISVLDMFAGAGIANGMMPAEVPVEVPMEEPMEFFDDSAVVESGAEG